MDLVNKFRDDRNWRQFHNEKDLAISISLEASELLELFQWKKSDDVVSKKQKELKEELADVLYWILLMGHDLDIDVFDALDKKIKKNEEKYPVEKAKGKHTKYDKL